MWSVLFVISLASAARHLQKRSGPEVTLTAEQTAQCLATDGYLSGDGQFPDADCCSFVVCDAARENKTGYLGKCMGGTVWNPEYIVCDDPKYFPSCDPDTCDVPKRTTPLCGSLAADQCCVRGREPVYTVIDADFGTYTVETDASSEDDNIVQFCPGFQVFNLEDCCCEEEFEEDPICALDPDSFYFTNPNDSCCTYLQCWANRTGYDVVSCMPPAVWNSVKKTCDLAFNVMECMTAACNGPMMTDPPCDPDSLAADYCCVAGVNYHMIDNITYVRDGDERANCCPEGLTFTLDTCACEMP